MIKVEISSGKLNAIHHDILIGEKVVKSLKLAGIPIQGHFTVISVDRGSLRYHTGNANHYFEWREDEDDRDTNWVHANLKNGSRVSRSGRHAEDDEL